MLYSMKINLQWKEYGTFDISKNVTDDEMKSCGAFFEQLLALN